MYKKQAKYSSDRCFSLIELLMVIAVIVLLMGMLLPALKKAKESGRAISCLNNMKQIGTYSTLYSGDYNDYAMPCHYPRGIRSSNFWIYMIANYMGIPWVGSDVNDSPSLLFCASRTDENILYSSHNGGNYAYNLMMGSSFDLSLYPLRKISACQKPAKASILGDGRCRSTGSPYYAIGALYQYTIYFDFRHTNNSNFLFLDGHATRFSRKLNGGTLSTSPLTEILVWHSTNYGYWSPLSGFASD